MSDGQLVERFTELTLSQDEALLYDEIGKYNRLFDEMRDVERELQSRRGDKRKLLKKLFDHPNAQVRLAAAKATLAIAPRTARKVLHDIIDAHEFPQAGDAGMTLDMLDDGTLRPS